MIDVLLIIGIIFTLIFLTILGIKYIIIFPNQENQIKECIEQNNFADAEFLLSEFLEKDPKNIKFLFWEAELCWKNNKEDKAYEMFSHLYNDHFNHFNKSTQKNILYRLISWNKKKEKIDEAARLAEKLLDLDDTNIDYLIIMGEILLKQNLLERSLTYFEKAKALVPDDAVVLGYIAEIYFHLKNYKQSLNIYTILSKKNPQNSTIWFRMAEISHILGNTNKSLSFYIRASQSDNETLSMNAFYKVAKIYLEQNNKPLAITTLEKVVFKLKNNKHKVNKIDIKLSSEIEYLLAELYLENQQISFALELWEEIYKYNPTYLDVKEKIQQYATSQLNDFFKDLLTHSGNALIDILCEFVKSLEYIIDSYQFFSQECIGITVSELSSKWRDIKRRKYLFIFWCSDYNFPSDIINKIYSQVLHSGIAKIFVITAGPVLSETRLLLENKSIDFYDRNNIKDLIDETKTNRLPINEH